MELEPVDSLAYSILHVETDKQEDKQKEVHVDIKYLYNYEIIWNWFQEPEKSLVYSLHVETDKKSDKQTDLHADIKDLKKYERIWNL